jgi:Kelch motif/Galactose oxidase, central domain
MIPSGSGNATKKNMMLFFFYLLLLALFCERTTSWSWTLIPRTGDTAAPRVSGHVAVTTTNRHNNNNDPRVVIVFGGLTGNAGSPCTDKLWTFSSSSSSEDGTSASSCWNCIDTLKEGGPGPRMYSAAAVLKDTLYVMGGWDPGVPKSGGTFLEDVWCLNLSTMMSQKQPQQWTKSQQTLPCGPVSRHAACTVGDTMIVVHTFRGIAVLSRTTGNELEWNEQPTTGDAPDGLSMCAMAPLTDTSLLVFGGSTKTQELSADAYVLDTTTWTWNKLDCSSSSSSSPSPRASPCAAQIRDNQCLVFGGASLGAGGYQGGAGLQAQGDAWILTVHDGDQKKGTWTRVESESNNSDNNHGPKPRLAATLCPWKDGGLLLQGGWDPAGETFDDTWILHP